MGVSQVVGTICRMVNLPQGDAASLIGDRLVIEGVTGIATHPSGCCSHHPENWGRSSVYDSRVRPEYPARNPAAAFTCSEVSCGS